MDALTAMKQALEALETDSVPLNAINNAAFFLRAAIEEIQNIELVAVSPAPTITG